MLLFLFSLFEQIFSGCSYGNDVLGGSVLFPV